MKNMNIDERIQALLASMEAQRANIDELRESMRASNGRIDELRELMRVNHDSLHANLGELFESMQRHDSQIAAINDQIAANSSQIAANSSQIAANSRQIATNSSHIAQLIAAAGEDAENIRALARIAESHERRIGGLEDERQ